MKITRKIILGFVTLMLIVSASNIYTTSHLFMGLHDEKPGASKIIFEPGTMLMTDFILILVAVAIAVVISKSIIKPLLKLKEFAEIISRGDMETRIDITSGDEIGDLARSFNQMADDFKRKTVSKDYVDNIINSMIDTLIVTSPEGIILKTNAAAGILLGYSEEELAGLPLTTVIDEKYPGNGPFSGDKFITGFIGKRETLYEAKDGRKVPVMLSVSTMREASGKVQGIVCVAQDITERKRAEVELTERMHHAALLADVGAALTQSDDLQTVLQSCTDSIVINLLAAFARIWTLNENGDILVLQASSGIYTHIDGPQQRIPLGKSRIGLIALERMPYLTNNIFDDPEIGEPEWAEQQDLKAFAGHPMVVADKLVGVVALFHYDPLKEITLNALSCVADEMAIGIERNNSKERLREYSRKLKKSNKELEQFAYVASHDLQEPLRKVMTFGDRLKTKYTETLGEHGRDYLDRMQGAAMRMQTLINDLLTFSRVMTKAQPFVPVDLAEITRDVVSDLEIRIEQTGAHIEIDKLEVIDADPLQMRQLLQNLIGNSLKFIKKDGVPVIKVSGIFVNCNGKDPGKHLSDNGSYKITVEDNGIGFDEKYADRIFGVFQRLHGRSEYAGTGIGLSICQKIVVRHNGSITTKSSPGEGAKFIVTLPVKQPEGTANNE